MLEVISFERTSQNLGLISGSSRVWSRTREAALILLGAGTPLGVICHHPTQAVACQVRLSPGCALATPEGGRATARFFCAESQGGGGEWDEVNAFEVKKAPALSLFLSIHPFLPFTCLC